MSIDFLCSIMCHAFNFKKRIDCQLKFSKVKIWLYFVKVDSIIILLLYDFVRRLDFWLLLFLPNQKTSIIAITYTFHCMQHSLHSVKVFKNQQRRIQLGFFSDSDISYSAKTCGQNYEIRINTDGQLRHVGFDFMQNFQSLTCLT